jgi:HSP20 family protein
MQKMFKNTYFKELIKDMFSNNFDSNTHFIIEYRMNKDFPVNPINQELINFPKKPVTKKHLHSDEIEPPIDIIEGKDTVSITIEIPCVKKEDIKIIVTENTLEINVNDPNNNYHKLINLPCNVKEKSTKTTYKNGIFDIVIKRKKKRKKEEGHKVDIK